MVYSMSRLEERVYDAWVVVRRAEDVAGEWVAHCLDFDVVAQGITMQEAADAAKEAVGIVLVDDVDASLDPYARRAPQRFWTDLYETISTSRPLKDVAINDLDANEIETLICRVSFTCVRVCDDGQDGQSSRPKVSVPLVFERTAHA